MDEDIMNDENDKSAMDEEDNLPNGDSNIIVIDEDAHSDSKNSDQPEDTDMIYIDDNVDVNPRHTPDIDIGRIKFDS